jgi:diguanylate cyclase (GGDEF)-like protein
MSLVELHDASHSSLRARLLWLVAVCVLPLVLTVAGLLYHNHELRRIQIEQSTLLLARKVMADVDSELSAIEAGLKVLATSPDLMSGDFRSFHLRARDALAPGIVSNYILTDDQGRQLLNTLIPFGVALPSQGTPGQLAKVFTEKTTVLTDLFIGPVTHKPVLAMGVPVQVGDGIPFSLNIGLTPARLNEMLHRQDLPDGWLIGVLDSQGVIIARSRESERFVGQKAVAPLLQSHLLQQEGELETVTKEGIPVFTAHVKSQRWHWGVVVGAPVQLLRQDLFVLWSRVLLATGVACALGWWLALHLTRQLVSSVQELNQAALDLCEGHPVVLPKIQWHEAQAVGAAIMRAAQAMEQEKYRAQHDSLTGLSNRALFYELVQRQLALAQRRHVCFAIAVIDLDGFKAVNDTDGHAAGDAVLKATAQRMKDQLRVADTPARLGGDEFAVLLCDTELALAGTTLERVVHALSLPHEATSCHVSASAGVAFYPQHGTTVDALMAQADRALYEAKRAGKNRVLVSS